MKKKFIILTLLFSMTFSLLGTNQVKADNYTAIYGDNSHGFNTYLIVPEDKTVPDLTFSYTIALAPSIEGTDTVFPVNNFSVVGNPTINDISFSSSDSKLDSSEGITLNDKEKVVVKETIVDFSNVTFSEPGIYRWKITSTTSGQWGVLYDTQVSEEGTEKIRYIDVYVIDNDGALEISAYLFSETADVVQKNETTGSYYETSEIPNKSLGFVNNYAAYSLIINNKTDGNQGSKDKGFLYTINLDFSNANYVKDIQVQNKSFTTYGYCYINSPDDASCKYFNYGGTWKSNTITQNIIVNIQDNYSFATMNSSTLRDINNYETLGTHDNLATSSNYRNYFNPITMIVKAKNSSNTLSGKAIYGISTSSSSSGAFEVNNNAKTVTFRFVLSDNEKITIRNLPIGTTYSVDVSNEDYLKYETNDYTATEEKTYNDTTSGTITLEHGNVYTGYTLTKNGVIPTGIFMNYGWPYIACGSFGLLALVTFYFITKKRAVL